MADLDFPMERWLDFIKKITFNILNWQLCQTFIKNNITEFLQLVHFHIFLGDTLMYLGKNFYFCMKSKSPYWIQIILRLSHTNCNLKSIMTVKQFLIWCLENDTGLQFNQKPSKYNRLDVNSSIVLNQTSISTYINCICNLIEWLGEILKIYCTYLETFEK